MENENEQAQDGVIEQEETTQEEIVEETPEVEEPETVTLSKSEFTKLKRKAIAYDSPKQTQKENLNNPNPLLSEELKLIARGLSDEAIDKAKVIAKGTGVSLTEALKDDMFIAYQDKVREEQRKNKAKLGASRGSGETSQEVTGFQSGATREQHLEAFKKAVGQS